MIGETSSLLIDICPVCPYIQVQAHVRALAGGAKRALVKGGWFVYFELFLNLFLFYVVVSTRIFFICYNVLYFRNSLNSAMILWIDAIIIITIIIIIINFINWY